MKLSKEISGWLVLLLVALASCHTEKATQRTVAKAIANQDAFAQLGNYWQILHPCINDTTTKEVVRYVQGKPVTTTDTIRRNDTVYITDRVAIHDTLYKDKIHTVIDVRALQQAKDSTTKYKALYEGSQHALASITELNQKQVDILKSDHAKALKASNKRGNGWMWKFWGLLAVCGIYAGFKTGLIGKLFKLLKFIP